MKKIFVISMAAVAALVACQKNIAPVVDEGVPMSITVSLGDQTKTAVKPEGNTLKSYWDEKETISIVTFDGNELEAKVLCIDNFTYNGKGGVEEATFKGTFRGGDDPKFIKVIYPAIDEKGNMAQYQDFKGNPARILGALDGQFFVECNIIPLVQIGDDNCDHLYNYCVAIGEAELKGTHEGELKMKKPLENISSVLKLEVRFPKDLAGKDVYCITLKCTDDKGNPRNLFATGGVKQLANFTNFYDAATTHEWSIHTKGIAVPENGSVTLYMPVYPVGAVLKGDTWRFTASVGGKELELKSMIKYDWKFGRGCISRTTVAFDTL